jgi:hypothetical protein
MAIELRRFITIMRARLHAMFRGPRKAVSAGM